MSKRTYAQVTTFAAGVFYVAVTLAMFAVPRFFFEFVGHFPPFNRHYMGDVAAFLLPLAIGLLWAARDPVRYRLVIAIGAGGSVVHTLNHAYDAIFEGVTHFGHFEGFGGVDWLLDFTPLVLLAAALIGAYYRAEPVSQTS